MSTIHSDIKPNLKFDTQGPFIKYKPGWQPGQKPKCRLSRNVLKHNDKRYWQEVEFYPPSHIQI